MAPKHSFLHDMTQVEEHLKLHMPTAHCVDAYTEDPQGPLHHETMMDMAPLMSRIIECLGDNANVSKPALERALINTANHRQWNLAAELESWASKTAKRLRAMVAHVVRWSHVYQKRGSSKPPTWLKQIMDGPCDANGEDIHRPFVVLDEGSGSEAAHVPDAEEEHGSDGVEAAENGEAGGDTDSGGTTDGKAAKYKYFFDRQLLACLLYTSPSPRD